jgi:hypothetical protein
MQDQRICFLTPGTRQAKGAKTMNREELLEAFAGGDLGSVEFFELALATDMTMAEIECALSEAEEQEGEAND